LVQLELIVDLGDRFVILIDVLDEIENWIRGSLSTSTTVISAGDSFHAISALREIFSSCEE
jgi:hypothetical protein